MKINFILILMFLFAPLVLEAQVQPRDTTQQYRIEAVDGNEYIGKIVYENKDTLTLKTQNLGVIKLRKPDIKRITQLDAKRIVNGEYWSENPQSTRYFWQPNAYSLKKGEGYFQNVWILFNQASIGVTDNFSIGAGIVPLFLLGGESSPVWLTPRVSIPVKRDKINFSTGALLGTFGGDNFGIVYGVTTFGSRDNNISLGGGYGYAGGDWAKSPTVTFSAMKRIGKRGYFITENYYIGSAQNDIVLVSFGGRCLIKNSGIDFGVIIPAGEDIDSILIPWLGVTFPLGKALTSEKQ